MTKRKYKNPRQRLEKTLYDTFSLYIRTRDSRCCTPGVRFQCSDVIQCGHLFTRSDRSTCWDERFSFGQCSIHNYMHEQHPEIMIGWFINKYGLELFNEGQSLTAKVYKPPLSELQEKIDYYKNKIKEL